MNNHKPNSFGRTGDHQHIFKYKHAGISYIKWKKKISNHSKFRVVFAFTLKDGTYFEGVCDQRSEQNPNEGRTEANGANTLYDGVWRNWRKTSNEHDKTYTFSLTFLEVAARVKQR